MGSYQDTVLDRLSAVATKHKSVTTSTSMRHANAGRLIAHDATSLRTLATIDFDFQSRKVHASLNDCVQPTQPRIGPRSPSVYWWTPGDPADDDEVARLLDAWARVIAAAAGRDTDDDDDDLLYHM